MSLNFHQIEITVYRGVRDTTGRRSTLHEFLHNVEYDAINALRATPDLIRKKQIKLSLPQATISGVFAPTRSADNLVRHSGLICIDIDRKDNLHIGNFDTLIDDVLRHLEQVAYASRSVSGNGYFLFIPLKFPNRHKQQFEALIRTFKDMGINIDRACGDVSRLRCQSYDLHQYINLNAKPFDRVYQEPQHIRRYNFDFSNVDAEDKVAQYCQEIAHCHIDLTANYDDWTKIGMALSSLGEGGRQWFHLCSSQNPKYNTAECDRKFNNFLRSSNRIGIGTFIYLCKNAGINI
ncbi:MAG: PriCT-2 domain-containing protein [Muribaculum sp.]|nr:PriCT-2 domain-containing protein [Muribaculum sp.]